MGKFCGITKGNILGNSLLASNLFLFTASQLKTQTNKLIEFLCACLFYDESETRKPIHLLLNFCALNSIELSQICEQNI